MEAQEDVYKIATSKEVFILNIRIDKKVMLIKEYRSLNKKNFLI